MARNYDLIQHMNNSCISLPIFQPSIVVLIVLLSYVNISTQIYDWITEKKFDGSCMHCIYYPRQMKYNWSNTII